jgi:hypothetical protein
VWCLRRYICLQTPPPKKKSYKPTHPYTHPPLTPPPTKTDTHRLPERQEQTFTHTHTHTYTHTNTNTNTPKHTHTHTHTSNNNKKTDIHRLPERQERLRGPQPVDRNRGQLQRRGGGAWIQLPVAVFVSVSGFLFCFVFFWWFLYCIYNEPWWRCVGHVSLFSSLYLSLCRCLCNCVRFLSVASIICRHNRTTQLTSCPALPPPPPTHTHHHHNQTT